MIEETTIIELNGRDPDIDGFYWTSKILQSNPVQKFIKFLSIEMPDIIATDGSRIHIYSPHKEYPNGLYRVLVRKKTHILLSRSVEKITYPDWRPVVPDGTALEKIELRGILSVDYTNLILSLTKIYPKCTLDVNYLSDLGSEVWDAFIYEKFDGIRFEGNRKIAVIMPLRR